MISHLHPNDPKKTLKTALQSSLIGCLLLGLVYLGLTYTAAIYSEALTNVPAQKMMYVLAYTTLGPHLGLVASIAIALACFTTLISLAMALSNIVAKELLPNYLSYHRTVVVTLLITAAMSFINLTTLLHMIHSIMIYCYPVIIGVTLYNLQKKIKSKALLGSSI